MMTAYERLQAARAQDRPTSRAYIENLFTERTELHGDRKYADDPAIIGGIGYLGDIPVTFIGIERGRDLQERIRCNFGCPMPEGYRKALRLMKQAEKFHRPVICFVDTSGAYCGEEAEERGQGQAIADNLMQMMGLETPIITIVIGEGGSGGALGLSVANRVYMLENAVFSVISPEGCASILWDFPQGLFLCRKVGTQRDFFSVMLLLSGKGGRIWNWKLGWRCRCWAVFWAFSALFRAGISRWRRMPHGEAVWMRNWI